MPKTVEEAQQKYAQFNGYGLLDLEADLDRILSEEMGVETDEPEHEHFEQVAEEEDITEAPAVRIMTDFSVDYAEIDEEEVRSRYAEGKVAALDDNTDSLIPPHPDE